MIYRVIIPNEVAGAISEQVAYLLSQGAPQDRLDAWLTRLFDRIESLYQWPNRFAVAEAVSRAKGYQVRRMNFGEYAIFYRVDEQSRTVEIIAFRHGRQRPWLENEA